MSSGNTGRPSGEPTSVLFDVPLFPETFAAFLRFHPALWRTRRLDRFVPLDLDLAEHQVTIQGLIDRSLVEEFIRRRGAALRLPSIELMNGNSTTLLIPSLSAPKRLLLNFSARDDSGGAVPIVSRADGSQITARDLLSRLISNRSAAIPELSDLRRVRRLLLLVATIASNNPHRLAERLEQWDSRDDALEPGRGLPPTDLDRWIRHEGDEFAPHGGARLALAASEAVDAERQGLGVQVPPGVRPDGLSHFTTLRSLLLHGIQDLLKTIVQTTEPWDGSGDELNRRARLMREFDDAAARVEAALSELSLLESLMRTQADMSANAEVYRHLDRWTAYAVADIRLGVPFILKFSQTLPLSGQRAGGWIDQKRRLISTHHLYPLALQDAVSVHAEVAVPIPELRMDRKTEVVYIRGDQRAPVTHVFGHELRPTGRLMQRYSSRRPEETQSVDVGGDDPWPNLYLRVQLKLLRSIWRGHAFAVIAFLLAGLYLAWVFLGATLRREAVESPEAPLAFGALAVTLSLWLMSVHHPRPIVYRKLYFARRAFYIALALILAPLIAYGAFIAWAPAWDRVAEVWGWLSGLGEERGGTTGQ